MWTARIVGRVVKNQVPSHRYCNSPKFYSYDCESLDKIQRYRLLCGAIIPRPIAVICTQDLKGTNNIMLASFFAPVTSEPTTISFALTVKANDEYKDTYRNIMETKEFVVCCLTKDFFEKAYKTSQEFGPDVDEFEESQLTPIPSRYVRAPRVGESPVALECRLYRSMNIGEEGKYGSATLIVGEVLAIHVDSKYFNPSTFELSVETVSRLGGLEFGTTGQGWEVQNPYWSTKNW